MNFTLLVRKLALVMIVMASPLFMMAQQKTISGKVTGENGAPVSGASVLVKGTSVGTQTAADGTFSISAPDNATKLVISSVGYASQEVSIKSASNVTVALKTSADQLGDVVVVGYGTRKPKDATGSIASLSTKDFNRGQISTPEQLLQGRTPGVFVTPASGEPGAAATINIRGTSSIRGNQEPLYVVDGVPISGGGTSGTASGIEGSSTPKNPLMFLNPNDIESISILKDASSAAIYGSRAANGVILITTKSGRGAKGAFQFSASTTVSNPASRYDLLNADDFISSIVKIKTAAGTSAEDIANQIKVIDKGAATDWQDQIFRTGLSQNYNLSWGMGNAKSNIRLSGSYDDQMGIIKNTGLKRMTGRLNFTRKFFDDRLRFDVSSTYSNVKNQYPPLTNNAGYQGSLIGAAISFNPTYPVFNPNGTFFDPGDGNRNPVEMLTYFQDNDNVNRFLNNLSASVMLNKDITYKATLGYDRSQSVRTSFADPRLTGNAFGGSNNVNGVNLNNPIAGNGRGFQQNVDLKSVLIEHTLNYVKNMNNSKFNGLLGYSYQTSEYDYSGQIGWGLTTRNSVNPFTGPGSAVPENNFNQYDNYYNTIPDYSKSDLQSYFARAEYSYKDKYYLTATLRIDGSSKFGKDNRYGTFPAFAAKWSILDEDFMSGMKSTFDNLSIRANYGLIGSQDGIGAYDAINLQRSYYGNSGQIETQFLHQGNPNLKWEQAATAGIGVDFKLKNSKISGTIDYYSTKRTNILFYGPVPGGFSATSYYFSNLPGAVMNNGLEFSVNVPVVETGKFKWDFNYNMTFLKNEVKDMNVIVNTGEVSGQGLTGAYAQTIQDGYSLFTWKMPVFNGFDNNGYAIYADGGKDQLVGSALPKFQAGMTNNFSYGKLTASIFAYASTGFYVYNNTANALFLKGSLNTAHNVDYATANNTESPINPGSVSTRFLEKGDFLRIANATLSYAFDVKSKVVKSMSAFVSGQNLALFTNYSGLDPEVNVDKQIGGYPSRGFDYTGYPKARSFTFGVNLGF